MEDHVPDQNEAKPAVFVTRRLPDEAWQELVRRVDAESWDFESPPPYKVLLEKIGDKDGLLCLLTDRIDERLIKAGSNLKVISQIAVGFDNIDVEAATAHGIRVGHTPGVLTEATADFAFTLLLAAARRVGEGLDYVRRGEWETWGLTLLLGQEVYGATLGVVGLGRIGKAVARRAAGFDMKVLYHSQTRDRDAEKTLNVIYRPLDELLAEADFVSLHVTLNEDTHHLIGGRELALMKPSAILINTARGPVVDREALYDALRRDVIAYAALDVTDPEPLPAGDKLLTLPNLLVTPHIASATVHSRTQMCLMAIRNLAAGVRGEPLPFPVN
jgi:glyoxylate reductase